MEVFKREPVDLVLADHFLSGRTGTEIALEMKTIKPDVPILIVSAAADTPEGIEYADEFLSKGEAPEVMLETIARLLKDRTSPGVASASPDHRAAARPIFPSDLRRKS